MVAPFIKLLQNHVLDLAITKPTALKESVKGGATKASKLQILIFEKPIILPVPLSESTMLFIQISDCLFLFIGTFWPIEKIIATIYHLFYDSLVKFFQNLAIIPWQKRVFMPITKPYFAELELQGAFDYLLPRLKSLS